MFLDDYFLSLVSIYVLQKGTVRQVVTGKVMSEELKYLTPNS